MPTSRCRRSRSSSSASPGARRWARSIWRSTQISPRTTGSTSSTPKRTTSATRTTTDRPLHRARRQSHRAHPDHQQPSDGICCHNGGRIGFGHDGKLYVLAGDVNDDGRVQNMNRLHGKILRLNDDGSIPADNPDPNSPIFAIGFEPVRPRLPRRPASPTSLRTARSATTR